MSLVKVQINLKVGGNKMLHIIRILLSYWKTRKNMKSFSNREQLLSWQNKKVKKYFKYILPKSEFYREFYKDINLDNWQSLPEIDKAIMMKNFDKLNTSGIKKDNAFRLAFKSEKTRDFSPKIKNITIGLSSGTSGSRGLFLVSDKERALWAGAILAKTLPFSIFKEQKIAFFLRANSNLYDTVKSNKIQFEFFDLLDTIDNHINRLNSFQPDIVVAPSSMLLILSKMKENKSLVINPIKVISVAEVLDTLDEKYIIKQFNQIVHQIYQCTEGFLATTCEYGTLHLNEDLLIIQKDYLDEHLGKFSPIITDFSRTTQPIIRYKLNDILTEKKDICKCGSVFTAIESIEGRCDDIFYLQSIKDNESIPIFPDFIRRAIICLLQI
jgi:putative adenylate-forming enzyme